MTYTAPFRDIHDRLRVIRITTRGADGTAELTPGASPFTTSMKEGKALYSPALYESATVQLRLGGYLFDIYSPTAQGTRVELLDADGGLLWTGYADPVIYNQGHTAARETVSISCSDALASLQHLKHRAASRADTVTLASLLARTIARAGAYRAFHVPACIDIPDSATADPLSSLVISEENFFARRRDARQTDDELAWTCREVLEEVCRYLGLTAVAVRDRVVLLDYDAIRAGDSRSWEYDTATGECRGAASLRDLGIFSDHAIAAADHAATGATLSLEKVYNKVEVTDSFYAMEDLAVDPFDPLKTINVTAADDPLGITDAHGASMDPHVGALLDVSRLRLSSDDGDPANTVRLFDSVRNVREKKWGTLNFVAAQYLRNPDVILSRYDVRPGGVPVRASTPPTLSYSDTKNFTGALLARFCVQSLPCGFSLLSAFVDWSKKENIIKAMTDDECYLLVGRDYRRPGNLTPQYTWELPLPDTGADREQPWHHEADLVASPALVRDVHANAASRYAIRSLAPTGVICLFNPSDNGRGAYHIDPDSDAYDRLPFFSVEPQAVRGGLVGGRDTYIVISGKLQWHYDQDVRLDDPASVKPYPVPPGQINPFGRRDEHKDRNYMYVPASECWTYAFLQHAGRSWNGSEWVDDPGGQVRFKLWYYAPDADRSAREVPSSVSTDIDIRDTVDYTMGLGQRSGLAIPLPDDGRLLEQTPRFGLCKPHDPKLWHHPSDDSGPHYYTYDRLFVKDLRIEVAAAGALTRDTDSETTFTNVIDTANASELPAVKLRVTTYDRKKFSYSNVGLRTASGTRFLGRFHNSALAAGEASWVLDNGEYADSADGLCAEEHLVYRYVNQYSRPARALTLTMHGAALGPAALLRSATLGDAPLVPVTIARDWRFDTARVKLVEKF